MLAALVLHGCAFTQRPPDAGPAPETVNVEPGPLETGAADPSEATPEMGDAAAPGDELMPEDPVVPDPADETVAGPTAAEIDRSIREMLGGDPDGPRPRKRGCAPFSGSR